MFLVEKLSVFKRDCSTFIFRVKQSKNIATCDKHCVLYTYN